MWTKELGVCQEENRKLQAALDAANKEHDDYVLEIFYALNPHQKGKDGVTIAPTTLHFHIEKIRNDLDAANTRMEQLEIGLQLALDYTYNSFEPNNQSRQYIQIKGILNAKT